MKITKSIGRLLLSFILLITMLPIDSMTVYADNEREYSVILEEPISVELSPRDVRTLIPFTVSVKDPENIKQIDFEFRGRSLYGESDSIPFKVNTDIEASYGLDKDEFIIQSDSYSGTLAIFVDWDSLNSAKVGVYTGNLVWKATRWKKDNTKDGSIEKMIPVTLDVYQPHKVTFEANGGIGTMDTDTFFASEGTYTLPPCGFTAPDGYTFKNWTVTWENEGGASSSTTHTARSTLTGLTKDITVSANWMELSLKVSPTGAGTAVYENGAFTATANAGYTFDHWEYANDEYTAAPIGTVWPTDNPYQPTEVDYKIYTAVFKANTYNLTVLSNNNERGNVSYSGTPKIGNTITLNAAANEGYTFKEWQIEPDGITINAKNKFKMPANDVTATAVFIPINQETHTVTANPGSGSGSYAEGDSGTITADTPDSGSTSAAQPASVTQPAPVIQAAPALTATGNPVTTTDSEEPFVEGKPDRSGWDAIKEDIQAAITNKVADSSAENTVMIDMDGSKKVPGDIISEIKGQDVTAVFDLGDGIKWSINGMDITGSDIKDIDLAVALDTNSIPGEVVTPLVGERYSRQISLAYEGDFGLTATLSVDMDAKNAGLFANLFYYNETKDELEFICANQIANDGIAELAFTHASDYVIVVDKEPMDGNFTEPEAHSENTVTGLGTRERTVESTLEETVSQSDARSPWRVIAICGASIAIGLCAFYVIMKRKQ